MSRTNSREYNRVGGDGHLDGPSPASFSDLDTTGPSRPVKRSFTISGHRTSISLENAFWETLRDIAERERRSLASIVGDIDRMRGTAGLSGAVRIWVLDYMRKRADF